MNPACHLHGLSAFVPETVLTNDDLAKIVDTSDEWIVTRTGIRQRHQLADTANASDLGVTAARAALEAAAMPVGALTHVIAATCTPDALSPSVACLVAGQLGAGPVMAFDVGAACSGFLYGLSLCQAFLSKEPHARLLLVCTEALTRRVNWQDRSTCVLFGDAAAACVLSADSAGAQARLVDVLCASDGAQHGLIVVGGGTACRYAKGEPVRDDFFVAMRGRETYKHAVRNMATVCREVLARNGFTTADVDLLVPHQANLRIIEAVGARLDIGGERVFTNVDRYGNTSSASIPLALAEARAQGHMRENALVLITAFGAGLTWGAALLRC